MPISEMCVSVSLLGEVVAVVNRVYVIDTSTNCQSGYRYYDLFFRSFYIIDHFVGYPTVASVAGKPTASDNKAQSLQTHFTKRCEDNPNAFENGSR